jgi:2'-hydroxyisoflavone reductase
MKILLLGGPKFVGYHVIEAALARGHELTLFNRGQTHADRFPEVERIVGDRDTDLEKLRGREWDAVIDTCGYFPRQVREAAGLLADSVGHYTFISTISVYADITTAGLTEDAELATLEDESIEEVTPESYGPLKVLCEQAAEAAMPGRVFNMRPGLIVGPHDPTDRFTYWAVRPSLGGKLLAPDNPDIPAQVLDVRDMAAWNIAMLEAGLTGTIHATGPMPALRLGDVINAAAAAAGTTVEPEWVSEAFLLENEVGPFVQLPLWVPKAVQGMMQVNVRRALDAGLTLRPIEDTIRDTLAWHQTRPADHEWQAGLKPAREQELLEKWAARD